MTIPIVTCCERMLNALKLKAFVIYTHTDPPSIMVEAENPTFAFTIRFCPFCGTKQKNGG